LRGVPDFSVVNIGLIPLVLVVSLPAETKRKKPPNAFRVACHSSFFCPGNPAVLHAGPAALRHQVALILPLGVTI
jgi:hypothetical protein